MGCVPLAMGNHQEHLVPLRKLGVACILAASRREYDWFGRSAFHAAAPSFDGVHCNLIRFCTVCSGVARSVSSPAPKPT